MSYTNWAQAVSSSIDCYNFDTDTHGSDQPIPESSSSRVQLLFRIVKEGKSDAITWANSNNRNFELFEDWHDNLDIIDNEDFGRNFFLSHILVREIERRIELEGDITSSHIDTELANL